MGRAPRLFLGDQDWEQFLFGDRDLGGLSIPFGDIPAYLAYPQWRWMKGYTGIVNAETIQGRIIEAHPRMSSQFVDLYDEGWIDAVVRLYRTGRWKAGSSAPRGYRVMVKAKRPGLWSFHRLAVLAVDDLARRLEGMFRPMSRG